MNKTTKILIYNPFPFHFEIIETCIVKIYEIFDNKFKQELNTIDFTIECYINESFEIYINEKYENIEFVYVPIHKLFVNLAKNDSKYDYILYITIESYMIYNLMNEIQNIKRCRFISHNIITECEHLKKNIIYLTPFNDINKYLECNILPFMNTKEKSDMPIYVVQGNLDNSRRDFYMLKQLLDAYIDDTEMQKYDFKIKLLGRGNVPDVLNENKYCKYLIHKSDLNFMDFHQEFLNVYCIIPLISKNKYPQYYTERLTSSINYGKAYDLFFLIDNELNDLYKLKKSFTYTIDDAKNLDSFYSCFISSLKNYYI